MYALKLYILGKHKIACIGDVKYFIVYFWTPL